MTQGFFQSGNNIITEIVSFCTSALDLLFISGPNGSSKSETIENVIGELENNHLIFRHFCFENTVIDDFLLNFYDALKNFSLAQKISLKKFATDNFKDKVSHYFKTLDESCIIIVENFEKVEDNSEIINFLSHLANYINVKIIIVSKNPDKNMFRFQKVKMQNIDIKGIDKDDFNSRLAILEETLDDELKEKFYTITQGLDLFLNMSIRYSTNTGMPIKELVAEFERKNITFEEFIITKFISLTPSVYQDLYRIFCALSHPVSGEFIDGYKLGNVSYIDYLYKNFLLSKFKNEFYVKDYFKKYIVQTFSVQERVSYYKKLSKIYDNELTKSPKDRLLRLSRESIRKEIERFGSLVPSVNSKSNKALPYIGISNFSFNNTDDNSTLTDKLNKIKERKNKLLESNMFGKKTTPVESKKNQLNENRREKNREFIIELINNARDCTKNYKYKDAINELSRAVDVDYDNEFKVELFVLIAKNYEFINEYIIAQKYYQEALSRAKEIGDNRVCEIEYFIAQTNKNLYKTNLAKEQLRAIVLNQTNSAKYRAMASIELGELEEANSNLNEAIKCYETALEFTLGKNKELTCKSYYRLAVLYDENQNLEKAIFYYRKNYTTSSERNENRYYSISLTNLALIYIEQGKYREAGEFLKLALSYDSENNDLENMYFSQKELAKLYSKFDPTSAKGYFRLALDTAQKLNDSFKIALIYFEAGEFYYDLGDDKKALKSFFDSKQALGENSQDENIERINSRIQDIKMRLDESDFNSIAKDYEN